MPDVLLWRRNGLRGNLSDFSVLGSISSCPFFRHIMEGKYHVFPPTEEHFPRSLPSTGLSDNIYTPYKILNASHRHIPILFGITKERVGGKEWVERVCEEN